MKTIIIAIITSIALSSCATISLDMPTKYGRVSIESDGNSALFGFKK